MVRSASSAASVLVDPLALFGQIPPLCHYVAIVYAGQDDLSRAQCTAKWTELKLLCNGVDTANNCDAPRKTGGSSTLHLDLYVEG